MSTSDSQKIMEDELGKLFASLEVAVLDDDEERIKTLHRLIALTQQRVYPQFTEK